MTLPATISGKEITLIKLASQYLQNIQGWHTDPIVISYTNTESKRTITELREWFLADYPRSKEQVYIAINNSNEPFGYLTVTTESEDKVEVGIVLGEKVRRTGLGYNALVALCLASFQSGVRKIKGRILPGNKAALALVEKIGFKYEGKQIKEIIHNGEYHDIEVFSLFQSDL